MSEKKIPLRKCTGCGEMKQKKELIRVLKTPEGEVVLDKAGKKNGRGAYLCNSPDCFKKHESPRDWSVPCKSKFLKKYMKCWKRRWLPVNNSTVRKYFRCLVWQQKPAELSVENSRQKQQLRTEPPALSSLRQTHQKIQKNCLQIKLRITASLVLLLEQKKNWGTRLVRNTVRHLQ